MSGFVYRGQFIYEAAMLLLYGRHYSERYRAIANLVESESSVLDLCCGPAVLYSRYLAGRAIQYTGIDVSQAFVDAGTRKGIRILRADVGAMDTFPSADFVILQASLYHFLPNGVLQIIDKMLSASQRKVIVAEPIVNLSSSNSGLLASLARRLTRTDAGAAPLRFDRNSLAAAMKPFSSLVDRTFLIEGGREMVYVLSPRRDRSQES